MMVKKEEMEVKVAGQDKEHSDPPKVDPSTGSKTTQSGSVSEPDEAKENMTIDPNDAEIELKDVERVLKEHGLEIDDLKGFWDQISAELKDLPTKKPLVTALGAFLIGFLAGRISRK